MSGASRKNERWEHTEGETVAVEGATEAQKLADNPMYRLEHDVSDEKKASEEGPRIAKIMVHLTPSLSHCHSLTLSHPHTITPLHHHSLMPSLPTPSRSRTLILSYSHSLTPSHSHTLIFSCSHSLTPSHHHSLTPSLLRVLSLSLMHTLILSCPHPLTLTLSRPHTVTPSHPHRPCRKRR